MEPKEGVGCVGPTAEYHNRASSPPYHNLRRPQVGGGITDLTAEFIAGTRYADLSDKVVNATKRNVIDAVGVMLAGASSPVCQILLDVFGAPKEETGSRFLGTSYRGDAQFAALFNGTAGHSLEYDDTQTTTNPDIVYGLLMHPTVPVFAASLAAAEKESISGSLLLLATAVGVEVACRMAEAIDPSHYERGLHCTGTLGTIGAAAAVAKILGLNASRVETALGIAASLASGLRENFGTMTKPLHAGRAAQSGVIAAYLAAGGFTAARGILEAPRGFSVALSSGWKDPKVGQKLGQSFIIEEPGIALKAYPCATLAHPAIDIMLELEKEHGIDANTVREVRAYTNSIVPKGLLYDVPTNTHEARFSLRYCVAVALLDRKAGLYQFSDERCNARDLEAFLHKVKHIVDPTLDRIGLHRMHTRIEVELEDGSVLKGEAEVPTGHPEKPLSMDDLKAKVVEILGFYEINLDAEEIIQTIMNIEDLNARQVSRVASL